MLTKVVIWALFFRMWVYRYTWPFIIMYNYAMWGKHVMSYVHGYTIIARFLTAWPHNGERITTPCHGNAFRTSDPLSFFCRQSEYMMTSSNGNIFRITGPLCGEFTGPGEFPAQRPVTQSFDVFFDLRLNKQLSKQPWGWWFETPSWSLWRQCNVAGDLRSSAYMVLTVMPLLTGARTDTKPKIAIAIYIFWKYIPGLRIYPR